MCGWQIFDKYIKRGAPLELMLDPILRAEIVKSIDEASVDIYNWAQHTCFEILLEQVRIPLRLPIAGQREQMVNRTMPAL